MRKSEIKHILNVLREGTVTWEGRREALKGARKHVAERISKKGKTIHKYHWKCSDCGRWYRNEKLLEVDHIEEVGAFTASEESGPKELARAFGEYVLRMYCREGNLQVLCLICHKKKTSGYNATRLFKRK